MLRGRVPLDHPLLHIYGNSCYYFLRVGTPFLTLANGKGGMRLDPGCNVGHPRVLPHELIITCSTFLNHTIKFVFCIKCRQHKKIWSVIRSKYSAKIIILYFMLQLDIACSIKLTYSKNLLIALYKTYNSLTIHQFKKSILASPSYFLSQFFGFDKSNHFN